jgi:hypothetical protein
VTLHFAQSVAGDADNPANALGPVNGAWAGQSGNASWTHVWRLDVPVGELTGEQSITLRLRKAGGTGAGRLTSVRLLQGATELALLSGQEDIDDANGVDRAYTFDSALVSDPADLRIEIAATHAGGAAGQRSTIQVDAATWDVVVADQSPLIKQVPQLWDGGWWYVVPMINEGGNRRPDLPEGVSFSAWDLVDAFVVRLLAPVSVSSGAGKRSDLLATPRARIGGV